MTHAELIAGRRAAQRHLQAGGFHSDPRGYWPAQIEADRAAQAADRALAVSGYCQAHRATDETPCECTETEDYYAGAYGTLRLCAAHREIAARLADDADAAMLEQGRALAQMISDERRMMRG